MSKNELIKRLEKIELTNPRTHGPSVNIHMWCPDGVAPRYTGGKTRVIASNAGEIIE